MKRILAGKYRILKRIGQGGMSKVYLATDLKLEKNWAIKEVIGESAIKEAEIMKRFDHPSLPRIVDIIEEGKTSYVVMDYIEGIPLDKLLLKKGKISQNTVIEWAKELASALAHLHGMDPPIIYRDMKPANIILQKSGHIKLIDFGIAREYDDSRVGDTQFLGTRGYAAPEQFGGGGQTDEKTDIYCLGITIYQLVTGRDPTNPKDKTVPIRHIDKSLSTGLEQIILKCTEKNPAKRYSSCKRLLYDLNNIEKLQNRKFFGRKKLRKKFSLIVIIILCTLVGAIIQNNSNRKETSENSFLPEDECSLLLKTIGEDEIFSLEEEVNILSLIENNKEELISKGNFSKLALELGQLYWYFYEYGDEMSRVKFALPWFEMADIYSESDSSEEKIAKIYEKIGNFHSEVTMNLKYEEESKNYYENILILEELVSECETEDAMARYEVGMLVLDSIEAYTGRFERDGVDKDRVRQLVNSAISIVKETRANNEKEDKLKDELISRKEEVEELINRTYIK